MRAGGSGDERVSEVQRPSRTPRPHPQRGRMPSFGASQRQDTVFVPRDERRHRGADGFPASPRRQQGDAEIQLVQDNGGKPQCVMFGKERHDPRLGDVPGQLRYHVGID